MTAVLSRMSTPSMSMAGFTNDSPALDSGSSTPSNDAPRPYKCTMCDKAFHRLEHQTRHIRTHTGEKPHVCTFEGCNKRFSRSDELTRHSRIHSNPHSRRNARGNHTQQRQEHGLLALQHMAASNASKSLPGSPNRSPPQGVQYPMYSVPTSTPQYTLSTGTSPEQTSRVPAQNPLNINLLATAASEVERAESLSNAAQKQPHVKFSSNTSFYPSRIPSSNSLSAYALSSHGSPYTSFPSTATTSPAISRSHSPSRYALISPQSTAPSSPSFSPDSLSPTPDITPLATPAHSPRARGQTLNQPYYNYNNSAPSSTKLQGSSNSNIQLPGLRQLSLGPAATLPLPLPHPIPTSLSSPSLHSFQETHRNASFGALPTIEPGAQTSASAIFTRHGGSKSGTSTPIGSYRSEGRLNELAHASGPYYTQNQGQGQQYEYHSEIQSSASQPQLYHPQPQAYNYAGQSQQRHVSFVDAPPLGGRTDSSGSGSGSGRDDEMEVEDEGLEMSRVRTITQSMMRY